MATFEEAKKEAVYKLALACMDGLDIDTAHRITTLIYRLPRVDEDREKSLQEKFWEGNPRRSVSE